MAEHTFNRAQFASRLGVKPQTVDTWRKRGILRPARDSNGQYVFTEADVARVRPRCELIEQRTADAAVVGHDVKARAQQALEPIRQSYLASAVASLARELGVEVGS